MRSVSGSVTTRLRRTNCNQSIAQTPSHVQAHSSEGRDLVCKVRECGQKYGIITIREMFAVCCGRGWSQEEEEGIHNEIDGLSTAWEEA